MDIWKYAADIINAIHNQLGLFALICMAFFCIIIVLFPPAETPPRVRLIALFAALVLFITVSILVILKQEQKTDSPPTSEEPMAGPQSDDVVERP